jgi:glyoxylase-like metal-dependent hydrolase (beta-lactamase superfamily II)/rhodanese-related sulfurtransferase
VDFEQIYLGCLAQASYLIGSDGEAVIVDPTRDVDEYIRKAADKGLRIRYVVETHLHADFVSGHRELAERTGAEIVIGAKAGALFPHRAVADGDELRVGRVILRFLETPGHTPESLSVLVIDPERSPEPRLVLTGDTLFIGDVGRPDLVGIRGLTPQHMAGLLYDSLHRKLLTLPDAVEVYPAHGAGSLCGKNISKETWSTIGEQRRSNHALQPMSREAFIAKMTADLPEQPRYFGMDVEINRRGASTLAARERPPALDPAAFAARVEAGAVVVDVRSGVDFGAGHVPGSINVGLGGQFASWAGTLLDPAQPVLIVAADDDGAREAVLRLARVGLENVAGSLAGGVGAWRASERPLATIPQITVADLRGLVGRGDLQVIDVRRGGEYAGGHVPGAITAPLDRLADEARRLDSARPTAVICAGGYRSSAASSLLSRLGFKDLRNVVGGTGAWIEAGYEVERPLT